MLARLTTPRLVGGSMALWMALLPAGAIAAAASQGSASLDAFTGKPLFLLLGLAALSLLPFVFVLVTSFLKISVVLSLVRSAFGAPQVPPSSVVTGLAAVLTLFVMAPVGAAMARAASPDLPAIENSLGQNQSAADTAQALWDGGRHAIEPLRDFLVRNAHPADLAGFFDLARQTRPQGDDEPDTLSQSDLLVVVPAFVTSQLKEAFEIGFLIFIPFLVIDLVISNVLVALGMSMLSPTTVSLPFKLLLFVLCDGWFLLSRGLVLGYR
jgi:type III secretion protein R